MPQKLKVLMLLSFYIPGYKAGGPVRTAANMVDCIGQEFDFFVITQDRDLGENIPYPEVQSDQWQKVGNAQVYYISPENCTFTKISTLISHTPHDVLYLNSFFDSSFTIKPLFARMLGMLPQKPVIVAPRGEFSAGALSLKSFKKRNYIRAARFLGLYRNVVWQASSVFEAEDISTVMSPEAGDIHIASDLSQLDSHLVLAESDCDGSEMNKVRVVFISRISRMKNLDFAISVLRDVRSEVDFDVYGPAEDMEYWRECQVLIQRLPVNVRVNYLGTLQHKEVAMTFGRYDLFFFPSLGENYGHVVAEALSVGTPVLTSDRTPWRNLEATGLGWDIPLDSPDRFVTVIEGLSHLSQEERRHWRKRIKKDIKERLAEPEILDANRELFRNACLKKQ